MANEPLTDRLKKRAAGSRRSSLYAWMMRNFDTFASTMDELSTPNWAVIADEFAKDGLMDANGKPPSPETARQTWYKVRQKKQPAAPALKLSVAEDGMTIIRSTGVRESTPPAHPERAEPDSTPTGDTSVRDSDGGERSFYFHAAKAAAKARKYTRNK